jgi:hypothetical protein
MGGQYASVRDPYRYARGNPVNLVDASGLAPSPPAVPSVGIDVAEGMKENPKPDDCGQFEFYTRWTVDPPSSKGGFVVQEVKLEFKAKYKGGKRDGQVSKKDCNLSLTFWECWEVPGKGKDPSGVEIPGNRTDVVLGRGHYNAAQKWDDKWLGPFCPCQEGEVSVVAKAAFYEGLAWDDVHAKKDMTYNNSQTPAGNILSTAVDPGFDKLPQYKGVKPLARSFKAHYSCPLTKTAVLGEKNKTVIDSIEPKVPPKSP